MDYDNWKLADGLKDEKIAFLCEQCNREIYVGEDYIKTDDANVHDACYDEYAWEVLGASREEAEEG